jgi:signal transduction histidine kinase
MTIRTRLNLWYAAILFVALCVMAGLSYHEFVQEKRHPDPTERNDSEQDVRDLTYILGVTVLPAVGLGLVGGWWLARQALAPVAALTQAAENIHERNLGEKIPRTGNGDELDRLTEVFNAMTARLSSSFQRIREFSLHASHELKTPLTVMHGELETALGEEDLAPPQRERILSQLDELQRLSRIVDGLTLLTKADAGQIKLHNEPVRLNELVSDVFADAQILAQAPGLELKLAACEDAVVRGDRHRLRQLLLNLADNAVKYNQPEGRVTMGLFRVKSAAEFVISNTGPGIPPEILPRVFDRFFRADAAHGREEEGCGLGLSIAQWIVSAHRGKIKIESKPANMTTVTVRLPLCMTSVKPS